MSGVFMDGGNHDAVSHGGGGDGGGHDHGSHGVLHGHGQGGHSFLAQILGLDHQDHAHLAHHGAEGASDQMPSQTAAWSSALQGLRIENLIAGINITPNHLLIMLFAAFIGWLGVIYFIRHHEPFANQVLGSSAAYAPTAGADQRLINSSRDALPFKTSASSGIVYVPQPQTSLALSRQGSPQNANLSQAMSAALGGAGTPQAMTAAPLAQSSAQAPAPQSYTSAPPSQSPVNQNLSAAMSAALGAGQSPPALSQATSPAMSPAMSAPTGFGQMSPMAGAMPFAAGGNARLFSARSGQAASIPGFGSAAGGGGGNMGMRLFSSRGNAPQAQSVPVQQAMPTQAPAVQAVANPNTWSLANQGNGTFSSDTAQFDSQFGTPIR